MVQLKKKEDKKRKKSIHVDPYLPGRGAKGNTRDGEK
jgi:hypothetical protein